MINMLIIIGALLLIMAVVFALPVFGVGLVIPVLGDIIDVPLSVIMGVAGVFLLIIGGFVSIIANYWWVFLIVIAIILLLDVFKIRLKVMQ